MLACSSFSRQVALDPGLLLLYLARCEPRRRPWEGEAPSEPASALGSHGGSPSRNGSAAPARSIVAPGPPPDRLYALQLLAPGPPPQTPPLQGGERVRPGAG